MEFFSWIENLGFSVWVRESGSIWAFPMFLFAHTLGMSIVAGGSTLISFALLGLWPKGAPIKPLEKMYPLIWSAFVLNAITGVALFCADATTRAANWDFWIKLVLVFVGVIVLARIAQEGVRQPRARQRAGARRCQDTGDGVARLLVRRHLRRAPHRLRRARGGLVASHGSSVATEEMEVKAGCRWRLRPRGWKLVARN